MKLTVNKYLNARIGEPSTNASCRFYRNPGDIIEIDDVVAGTEIDGNAVWYHCKDDGCFYWSGGTEEANLQLKELKEYDQLTQIKILKSAANANEMKWSKTIPNYSGCGIGLINTNPETIGLLIYVSKKLEVHQNINESEILFRGVKMPMGIVEVENIEHNEFKKPDRKNVPCMELDNDSPYRLGGTIGMYGEEGYGSRSLRLFKGNECYVMTCFHVLLNDLKSQQVFGPYTSDSTKRNAGVPAKVNKAGQTPGKFPIIEGYYNTVMDFAVAKINEDLLVNGILSDLIDGFYTYDMLDNLLLKEVKMVGSTSFHQTGKVTAIGKSRLIDGNNWKFKNCLIAEKISSKGDSGGPVVDENKKLVGYVIADSDSETVILPFFPIFSNTGYRIKKPSK